jgi:two-component system KDP operon response regulator KdpE
MRTRHLSSWVTRSAAAQPLILVIEDEPHTDQSLVSTLASQGFRTLSAGARASALTRAVEHGPDLVLLDLAAPGVEGADLATRLREGTGAPIVVLLDRAREHEKGMVLDAGANDYILRPFSAVDLLARIRIWLRETVRSRSSHSIPEARADRIRIDRDRRSLFVEGREVHITPIECKLLLTLARGQGKAMTEDQILSALWGPGSTRTKYLRTQVRQLRLKIERDPARPRHLLSEMGGGYRLKLS